MDAGSRRRSLLVGALFGVVWPFALTSLLAFSGHVTIPLIRTAYELGLDMTSARVIVRVMDAVLWSVILGGLFGIPLGLITRSNVVAAWVGFLIAILVVSIINSSRTQFGVGLVLLEWSIPETWVFAIAVLALAQLTAHFIAPKGTSRATAAP